MGKEFRYVALELYICIIILQFNLQLVSRIAKYLEIELNIEIKGVFHFEEHCQNLGIRS